MLELLTANISSRCSCLRFRCATHQNRVVMRGPSHVNFHQLSRFSAPEPVLALLRRGRIGVSGQSDTQARLEWQGQELGQHSTHRHLWARAGTGKQAAEAVCSNNNWLFRNCIYSTCAKPGVIYDGNPCCLYVCAGSAPGVRPFADVAPAPAHYPQPAQSKVPSSKADFIFTLAACSDASLTGQCCHGAQLHYDNTHIISASIACLSQHMHPDCRPPGIM